MVIFSILLGTLINGMEGVGLNNHWVENFYQI